MRDTVDIYFLKARQRRLSLRFLSWFVLHAQIQTDMHDSIEDARSALELYNTYKELKSQGLFGKQLEDIYKEGRQYVKFSSFFHSRIDIFLRIINLLLKMCQDRTSHQAMFPLTSC